MSNSHEELNRLIKAVRIASLLRVVGRAFDEVGTKQGLLLSVLREAPDEIRDAAAQVLKIHRPSGECWELAVAMIAADVENEEMYLERFKGLLGAPRMN